MQKDLQIVFRGVEQSDSIEHAIHKKVDKLERFCDNITACRVVVDSPHNNHQKGKKYHVTVDISVPQQDIVVAHDQHDKHGHQNLYIAIRDAFNAAERRLKKRSNRERSRIRQPLPMEFETDEAIEAITH